MWFLAAADPGGNPTVVLLQYGAVGAFVVVLGAFAYTSIKRERDRGDRLEKELSDANNKIIDRLAEVLVQSREALVAANDYLRDLALRRRERDMERDRDAS